MYENEETTTEKKTVSMLMKRYISIFYKLMVVSIIFMKAKLKSVLIFDSGYIYICLFFRTLNTKTDEVFGRIYCNNIFKPISLSPFMSGKNHFRDSLTKVSCSLSFSTTTILKHNGHPPRMFHSTLTLWYLARTPSSFVRKKMNFSFAEFRAVRQHGKRVTDAMEQQLTEVSRMLSLGSLRRVSLSKVGHALLDMRVWIGAKIFQIHQLFRSCNL